MIWCFEYLGYSDGLMILESPLATENVIDLINQPFFPCYIVSKVEL